MASPALRKRPYVIGLTGNIATGKSTVLAYLAEKGAHIVDADKLAHKAMAPGGPAYEKVIAAFGDELVKPDGLIDRVALGKIVFADPAALERLETIVHPATFEMLRWDVMQSDAAVLVLEAIKLLESGRMLTFCDEIWVITSSPASQLERLITRRNMSEEEARQRMEAQTPQAEKVAKADFVVSNDSTPAALQAQLEERWHHIEAKMTDSWVDDLMNAIKRFWTERPLLSNWAILALGMVIILYFSARHVGFLPGQWAALVGATVLLAGLCAWIISWE